MQSSVYNIRTRWNDQVIRVYERRKSGHFQLERRLQQKDGKNAQMTTCNGSPAVQIKIR
jgi:hypothetical protein